MEWNMARLESRPKWKTGNPIKIYCITIADKKDKRDHRQMVNIKKGPNRMQIKTNGDHLKILKFVANL